MAGISLFVRMAPVNVSDDVFLININYCKLATRIWSWSLWLTDKHTECWKWNGEKERIINVRLFKHWNRIVFSGELQQPSQSCSIHVTLKIVYSLFKIHAFIEEYQYILYIVLFNIHVCTFSLITGMWNVKFCQCLVCWYP